MKISSDGRIYARLLPLVVGILVVGGLIYATYAWQHAQLEDRNQQISQLQQKLNDASSATPSEPAQTPSSTIASYSYTSEKGVTMYVYLPQGESTVSSPIYVLGRVPGNWSFEATFPIKLQDGSGKVIAQSAARLLDDWTTDKLVPFYARLTFSGSPSGSGTLVLEKDNPSGVSENNDKTVVKVMY